MIEKFHFCKAPQGGYTAFWDAPVVQTTRERLCRLVKAEEGWVVADEDLTDRMRAAMSSPFKRREDAARWYLRHYVRGLMTFDPKVWNRNPSRPTRVMTEAEAEAVWDVLAEECGVRDRHTKAHFIDYHTREHSYPTEYRVGGWLGYGGKFWNDHHCWRVDTYEEARSPAIDLMLDRANARLQAMFLQGVGSGVASVV